MNKKIKAEIKVESVKARILWQIHVVPWAVRRAIDRIVLSRLFRLERKLYYIWAEEQRRCNERYWAALDAMDKT